MTDDRHHPPTEPEASVGGRPVSRVTHTFVVGNDFFGEKWMAECTCGWDADDRFPSRMQAKDAHTAHIAETVIALSEELDRKQALHESLLHDHQYLKGYASGLEKTRDELRAVLDRVKAQNDRLAADYEQAEKDGDEFCTRAVNRGAEIKRLRANEAVLVSIIDRMKAWEPMHVTDAPHWGIKGGWYWRYRTPYGPKPEPMTPDQMAYFEDGGEKEGS